MTDIPGWLIVVITFAAGIAVGLAVASDKNSNNPDPTPPEDEGD